MGIEETLLEALLANAFLALSKEEDVDYIVQKTEDKKLTIKIIDKENTGRICHGMRWNDGLHAFLEIKHQIQSEKETITPLAFSRVTLYGKYTTLFGLSGTLGSEVEREMLKAIYQVESFDIPPHLPSQRVDFPPRFFSNEHTYTQAVLSSVQKSVEQGRPILILAESIKKTKNFAEQFLKHGLNCQVFNETQEDASSTVIVRGGLPGAITIATNNAGRGLHLPLTPKSKESGGLHVLFTFYPFSERVEQQGLGRAGRQGEKGTSEIVVYDSEKSTSIESVQQRQELRKKREVYRAAQIIERAKAERLVFQYAEVFWEMLNQWKKKTLSSGEKIVDQFEHEKRVSKNVSHVVQLWVEMFYKPSEEWIVKMPSFAYVPILEKLFKESKRHWETLLK